MSSAPGAVREPHIFKHVIQVRWADCDPARIAYTGRIPYFALESIDAFWAHHLGLDWFSMNIDRDIGFPFVHLSVDFRVPVTPRQPLECHVRITKVGESSVSFAVDGYQAGILCFEGKFVEVHVAAAAHRREPIPADLKDKLLALCVAA